MEHFIDYLLAADGEDIDSWANILFIIVIAAFWVISAILKAKGQKLSDSKKKGEKALKTDDKEQRKQKSLIESMLGEVLGLPEEETVSQTVQKKAEDAKHYLKEKRQKPAIRRSVVSKHRIPEKADAEIPSKMNEIESAGTILEKKTVVGPSPRYSISLFEHGKSDLRKAILYSEILGKPLSLREKRDSLF